MTPNDQRFLGMCANFFGYFSLLVVICCVLLLSGCASGNDNGSSVVCPEQTEGEKFAKMGMATVLVMTGHYVEMECM